VNLRFLYSLEREHEAAVAWYRKATPKRSGTLVSRTVEDREAAVAWYRKAAEQGDAVAQHSLGDAYYD
jgi:hypothetical protein